MRKNTEHCEYLAILRGKQCWNSEERAHSRVYAKEEMHAGSAGIRHRCGHAPCWNTIGMRTQMGCKKMLFCVRQCWNTAWTRAKTSAGTRCWRTVKKGVENSWEFENSGKQVVKRPRVLTPQCWKHCVLRGSFSEKFDTTNQNHCFCRLIVWENPGKCTSNPA